MFKADIVGEAEIEAAWGRVVAEIRVGAVRGAGLGAKEGAEEARRKHVFRNRTGELEKSISHITIGWVNGTTYVAKIVAGKKYASWVEDGTRPHLIVGNPWLVFEWKGVLVRFRYVNHPGTKPHPFMGIAYQKAERVVIREHELAVARAARILDKL